MLFLDFFSLKVFLPFSFFCWYNGLPARDKDSLNNTVKVCSKIIGIPLRDLHSLREKRVTQKAKQIVSQSDHILSSEFTVKCPPETQTDIPCPSLPLLSGCWMPTGVFFKKWTSNPKWLFILCASSGASSFEGLIIFLFMYLLCTVFILCISSIYDTLNHTLVFM